MAGVYGPSHVERHRVAVDEDAGDLGVAQDAAGRLGGDGARSGEFAPHAVTTDEGVQVDDDAEVGSLTADQTDVVVEEPAADLPNSLGTPLRGAQWRRDCASWTAFFTTLPILASAAAVSSFSANAVGHMAPSSRFADSSKPNVAYRDLNL